MASPLSQNIELVISDLQDKFQKSPCRRRDTVFYWAVRGGNYDTVATALTIMKERKMQSELDWLLNPEEGTRGKCDSLFTWLKKLSCFPAELLALVVICFLALTPVFPVFYAVFSEVFSRRKDSYSYLKHITGGRSFDWTHSNGDCFSWRQRSS